MAKLNGILPLEGTIGNMTFIKTEHGIIVKSKGGVSKQRIATDPAFQRTRENGQEFGSAVKATKLFRSAFRSAAGRGLDNRFSSRLTQTMMAALKADTVSLRGQRNVTVGDLSVLEGLEFNRHAGLTSAFVAPFTRSIDRATGAFEISIPPFVPESMIKPPAGATHFHLSMCGADIDFYTGLFTVTSDRSGILPIDGQLSALLSLSGNGTAGSTNPLFLTLGISFYQQVNGQPYALSNCAYNAMAVVATDV